MMNKYCFSEDNRESLPDIMDRSFTENQLKEIYRDIIDKTEYKDFSEWFFDMLKSGLIIHRKNEREEMKMKKSEIVENIITVLNWGQKNKEYKNKIIDALDGVNWYLSNELMTRVLMRLSKARLTKIQHDVIEAIY